MGGSCGYGPEACRVAAQQLNLKVGGIAWYPFEGKYKETGCFAYSNWPWKGYAWYGLRDDGSDVQGETDLTAVGVDRFRLEGTHNCSAQGSSSDGDYLLSGSTPTKPLFLYAAILVVVHFFSVQL